MSVAADIPGDSGALVRLWRSKIRIGLARITGDGCRLGWLIGGCALSPISCRVGEGPAGQRQAGAGGTPRWPIQDRDVAGPCPDFHRGFPGFPGFPFRKRCYEQAFVPSLGLFADVAIFCLIMIFQWRWHIRHEVGSKGFSLCFRSHRPWHVPGILDRAAM